MYSIKQITSQETYPVRQPVLRPGKPIESCIFDGDDLPDTAHFGIYDNNNVIGIVSVFKASSPLFSEAAQFQLRGMAVLPAYQKLGLGDLLLKAAEDYIKSRNSPLIWFNAREIAVGFYKKAGYSIKGDMFKIPDVGPHYVMYKPLS